MVVPVQALRPYGRGTTAPDTSGAGREGTFSPNHVVAAPSRPAREEAGVGGSVRPAPRPRRTRDGAPQPVVGAVRREPRTRSRAALSSRESDSAYPPPRGGNP